MYHIDAVHGLTIDIIFRNKGLLVSFTNEFVATVTRGEDLQEMSLLQGLASIILSWIASSRLVLVDTETVWSERLLLWQRLKIISESNNGLLV